MGSNPEQLALSITSARYPEQFDMRAYVVGGLRRARSEHYVAALRELLVLRGFGKVRPVGDDHASR